MKDRPILNGVLFTIVILSFCLIAGLGIDRAIKREYARGFVNGVSAKKECHIDYTSNPPSEICKYYDSKHKNPIMTSYKPLP